MFYYKVVDHGYIIGIGTHSSPVGDVIPAEEYDFIMGIIQNKPEDTEETWYRLNDLTLCYEPFDWPEEEEIQDID